jgi:hypothetical protein
MRPFRIATTLACLTFGAGQGAAQSFTTPEEVRPILQMTRANWVAIGTDTGNDLFYFSHIAAWRCGFSHATYRLNGGTDEIAFDIEPCYRDTAQPNAIRGLPFVVHPQGSITSVIVTLHFPDGTAETAKYERRDILPP